MSRFNSRVKALNDNEMYENTFDKRGVKQVVQYTTEELIYPDEEDKKRINVAQHAWVSGDKFWKLALKYYGDQSLWYIIAQWNQTPTEGHLMPGDIIEIPTKLNVVLGAFE